MYVLPLQTPGTNCSQLKGIDSGFHLGTGEVYKELLKPLITLPLAYIAEIVPISTWHSDVVQDSIAKPKHVSSSFSKQCIVCVHYSTNCNLVPLTELEQDYLEPLNSHFTKKDLTFRKLVLSTLTSLFTNLVTLEWPREKRKREATEQDLITSTK